MMEKLNLMDVPTHSTKRIERYGVLALILFLTTFAVLYLWETGDSTGSVESTAMARSEKGPRKGVELRSKASQRIGSAGHSQTYRRPGPDEPALATRSSEQKTLAERKYSLRAQGKAEEKGGARPTVRNYPNVRSRFPVEGDAWASGFDSPAPDVSTSAYVGRWKAPFETSKAVLVSAPRGQEMEYVVKEGDCLSKIAQRELGSIRHLARLSDVNGLRSDSLRVGQRLILPHIGDTAPVRGTDLDTKPVLVRKDKAAPQRSSDGASPKAPTGDSTAGNEREYVVKAGDCLSEIAQQELGSIRHLTRLREANGLTSNSIRVGQRLVLPQIGDTAPVGRVDQERPAAPAANTREWKYVMVKEGDSLWKIAVRELGDGDRYDEIKQWNDLKSDLLRPGAELRIKKSADAELTSGGVAR